MSDPPRIIGRYALYGKIASGGMATVHLGRLLGPVGFSRTVAIKRMHPHFTEDPEFVSMFLDEARLAARIRHPNVVPTLDVVATERELFLVMDYVQGETLARLSRLLKAQGKTIPLPIVGAVFSGVLHGLHAAHEAKNERGEPLGMVHRDVSPQNVIVGTDGVARVLDFGVAKAAGRVQSTRAGQIKGKIAYMAPEQVRGKPATRQTDVYAVAVVLWEALTGKRLFQDDNDAALMQRVLDGDVPPPSSLVAEVPAAFDALVLRGLDREPSRRFATAREMAAAIESLAPLAIPVQVGEWVDVTAGPAIASQAARVAEIESASDASVFSASEATQTVEAPPAGGRAAPRPGAASPAVPMPAPQPPDAAGDVTMGFPSDETLVAEHPPVVDPPEEASPNADVAGETGGASQMSSISVAASPPSWATRDRRATTRLVLGGVLGACALIGVTALVLRAAHSGTSSDVTASGQPAPELATAGANPLPAPTAQPPEAAVPPPVQAATPAGAGAAASTPPTATPPEVYRPPPPRAAGVRRTSTPPQQPPAMSRPTPPTAPPAPSTRPKSGILFSNPG